MMISALLHAPASERLAPPVLDNEGPILLATKPYDYHDAPLAMARWLADRDGRELHVVSVLEPIGPMAVSEAMVPPVFPDDAERTDLALDIRKRLVLTMNSEDRSRVDVLVGGSTGTLVEAAHDRNAHMIVIGTGRHGAIGRFVYGERALQIVRIADRPVLVVPPFAMAGTLTRAVVAVDFSAASLRAAQAAVDLLPTGGELALVHVKVAVHLDEESVDWWDEAYTTRTGELFERFRAELRVPRGVRVITAFLRGDIATTLLRYATDAGAGLIACGRHSYTFVQRVLLGSVSTSIIRRAACPVLIVPEDRSDSTAEGKRPSDVVRTDIREQWAPILHAFSAANSGRRIRCEVEPAEPNGAGTVHQGYVLLGVDFIPNDDRVDIMLGDPVVTRTNITHCVAGLRSIAVLADAHGRNSALKLYSVSGVFTVTLTQSG